MVGKGDTTSGKMVGLEVEGQETNQGRLLGFRDCNNSGRISRFGEISYCRCSQFKHLEDISLEYIENNV
jgi:hypothetical protein